MTDDKIEIGSGNVFEDLQMENPQVRLLKAQIAGEIHNIIQQRKLNQKAAAQLLGIDQPKVSALANGRLSGFTIDRLVKFLDLLGQDVKVSISPRCQPILIKAGKNKAAPCAVKEDMPKKFSQ